MAEYELKVRLLPCAHTAAEWASSTHKDKILQAGEIGYEKDTGRYKMGDGETKWASLSWASAEKLSSSAGSATQPIYFSEGKPVACTYSLNKTVPADAQFTDTNTWRGIQNNLTSTSTTESLSAAQGKILNEKFANYLTTSGTAVAAKKLVSAVTLSSYAFTPSTYIADGEVVGLWNNNGSTDTNGYPVANTSGGILFGCTNAAVVMAARAGQTIPTIYVKQYYQSWGDWVLLLHSKNYNNYALPLTGGTMSTGAYIKIPDKSNALGASYVQVYADNYYTTVKSEGIWVACGSNYLGTGADDSVTKINAKYISTSGSLIVNSTSDLYGKVKIHDTTEAISAATAATVLSGGLGVAKQIVTNGKLFVGHATAGNAYIYLNSKNAIQGSDGWLRLNNEGNFASGIYCGSSKVRTDGSIQVGSSSQLLLNNNGNITSSLVSSTHLAGNQGTAIINSTAGAGTYTMLAKMNTTNGYMTIGSYQTGFHLYYTTKTIVDTNKQNTYSYQLTLLNESGASIFPGAVSSASSFTVNRSSTGGGFYIQKGGTTYGQMYVSVIGTAGDGTNKGTQGIGQLVLGNSISQSATSGSGANNAIGVLTLYGPYGGYSNLRYEGSGAYNNWLPQSSGTLINNTGGTFLGAVNFANNVWNKMGDDASIGDCNQAGCVGIKGLNGATGIYFTPYSGSTAQKITINGSGTMTITGTVASTFSGSLSGNASSASSLLVRANNSITSTTNDTTANWGAYNTSIHWYSKTGQLTDQPSQYGYIFNVGTGSEVHQIWMTQSSGNMLHRGGNASGWNGSWRTLFDSSNYTTYVVPKTGGTFTGAVTINGSNALNVGTQLKMWSDGEGGNIRLFTTTSTTNCFEFDGYDGNLRLYYSTNGGSSASQSWSWKTNGVFQTPYLGINGSSTSYRLYCSGNGYFTGNLRATYITLTNTQPLIFHGVGTGTYQQGAMYCNSSGIAFETPRATESSSGTVLGFYVNTRGGSRAPLYCGNLSVTGNTSISNGLSVTGNVTITNTYYPTIYFRNTANACYSMFEGSYGGAANLWAVGTSGENYRRAIAVYDPQTRTSLTNALTLRMCNAGTWTEYNVLHTGNYTSYVVANTGGTFSGKLSLNGSVNASNSAAYYSGAIEVREAGLVGSAQNALTYAPKIGFHWGGIVGCALALGSNGYFYRIVNNGNSYKIVDGACFSLSGTTLTITI